VSLASSVIRELWDCSQYSEEAKDIFVEDPGLDSLLLASSVHCKSAQWSDALLFCQLSLNMLGRQQRLILLVEKDQQVLQIWVKQ
jgi:hypothetical protein